MDPDSSHHLFCPCGHHTGPNPKSHPVLSVSYKTTCWSPDTAGALAFGLHICTIPAGASAAAPHHADVIHIQLQEWEHISQHQEEEEVTHNHDENEFTQILAGH